jgi:hypothetical protein
MGRRWRLDGWDCNAGLSRGRHGGYRHRRGGRSQGEHRGSAREKAREADEGTATARHGGEALKTSPRREGGGAEGRWTEDAGGQTFTKTMADVCRRLDGRATARQKLRNIRRKGF